MLADLDRAGFIERHPDPADRRRTIVAVIPAQDALIREWLDGAARPLARVLDKLTPGDLTQKTHDYFMAQFTRPDDCLPSSGLSSSA